MPTGSDADTSSWWDHAVRGATSRQRLGPGGDFASTPGNRGRCSSTPGRPNSAAPFPNLTTHPLPFFMRCVLLLTGSHRSTKVSNFPILFLLLSLFSFLFAFPRELLLLLSGQCPNPGPPRIYPCTVCHLPIKRQYSCHCTLCGQWVHSRCSGLAGVDDRRANPTWVCPPCAAPLPPRDVPRA